jgi:RNA polymerase sigma-70 factor, ECF subfamily
VRFLCGFLLCGPYAESTTDASAEDGNTRRVRERRRSSDHRLVAAAKRGDPAAWRELYERVGGRLYGWLRAQSLLDTAQDADDLASEAWLVAASKIHTFAGGPEEFTSWIFAIARNLVVNANRRARRRGTVPTDLDPRVLAPDADPRDPFADSESHDWIRQVLSDLTPRERDVVTAIDVAGLDIATTCAVLNMSASAVRVAHHRAIRRLSAIMSDPARLATVDAAG